MQFDKNERLNSAIAYLKGKKIIKFDSDITGKLEYNRSTLSGYTNNTAEVSNKFLELFGNAFEISTDWLINGSGSMTKQSFSNARQISVLDNEEVLENKFGNKFYPLENGEYEMDSPVLQDYSRGGPMAGFADREYFDELPRHRTRVKEVHSGKYITIYNRGESMDYDGRDCIKDGAAVTGRQIQKNHWKNKLHLHRYPDYIIAHKDGFVTKRISCHDVECGKITCHSLNQETDKNGKLLYPDFELSLEDVDHLFNIISVQNPR